VHVDVFLVVAKVVVKVVVVAKVVVKMVNTMRYLVQREFLLVWWV
jgi:hypothetical protein